MRTSPLLALLAFTGCRAEPVPEPWEREPDYYEAHSILRHVHRPLATRTTPVPEHPQGSVTFRTNARGFRSDREYAVPKPGRTFRVLVTGDSHTDGVVDNADSFAPELERLLRMQALEAGHDLAVEVVNGGTGYWGPTEYGAAFSVWADLEPDLCVVVLYEGNDFLDVVASEERRGLRGLQRRPDHYERLLSVGETVGERVSQQLNQDLLFTHDVVAARDAVQQTGTALLEAHTACHKQQAPLIVVRLPPVGAVHPPSPREARAIHTEFDDLFVLSGRALGDRLAVWLRGRSPELTVLDLWEDLYRSAHGLPVRIDGTSPWESTGMKTAPRRVYWSTDHHLSVHGHSVLAQRLALAITLPVGPAP